MKINNIIQSVQSQSIQPKGKKAESQPVSQKADKVEISKEARSLAQSGDVSSTAYAALKNATGIREDKVQEIREKITQDFYSQENVGSAIADKILKELGI